MVRASTSPESGSRARSHPGLRAENPGVDRQARAARRPDPRACHRADLPDRVRRPRFIAGEYGKLANSPRIASR